MLGAGLGQVGMGLGLGLDEGYGNLEGKKTAARWLVLRQEDRCNACV